MTSPWRELTTVAVAWLAIVAPMALFVVEAVNTHRSELRDAASARALLSQARALAEQRQAAAELTARDTFGR
jgi:heme exporter protein D